MTEISFEQITASIGAYVTAKADEVIAGDNPGKILAAMNHYGVLVFPELHLSDDVFVQLCSAMGDVHDPGVTADESAAAEKGLYRIALDKDDKTQLEFVQGNDWWHMDGTIYDVPGKSTMLKCENPPSTGGDTGFANLFAAWNALPENRQNDLKKLEVVHCMAAVGKKMYDNPSVEDFARWNAVFPDTRHPLVWQHRDGRVSMVIGSTADRIIGMSREDGDKLLHELLEWSTRDEFTYRHKWKKGDLVMFNNPGMLHRSYPYEKNAGRVMHRLTLKGTEPFASMT